MSNGQFEVEHVGCIFGHETPPKKLFGRKDLWLGLDGDFAWNQCPDCELIFLSPRPTKTSINHYYPDQYPAYKRAIEEESSRLVAWKRRRNLQPQIQCIQQRAPAGKLLDIGCATGIYLNEMQKRGWQVTGVEPNEAAGAYASTMFDLNIISADLLHADIEENSFDVVTFWDVVEHLHNPLTVLQEAHRVLRPNGLLVFSIPELNSRDAKSFGPEWIGYDTPRHLHIFHGQNLTTLLNQCGFGEHNIEHFLATYHMWRASWEAGVTQNARDGWQGKLSRLPIWAPLTAPYFSWINRIGLGSVATVYARAQK